MSRVLFSTILAALIAGCNLTPVDSHIPGYVTTPDGQLVFDDEGRCWRTANWQPSYAIPQCDPAIFHARRQAVKKAIEVPPEEDQLPEESPEDATADEEAETTDETEADTQEEEALDVAAIDTVAPEELIERPLRFDAEASFHFGHYRLTRQGGEEVERLARRLRMHGAEDIAITVVGHTDRIGDPAANLALSERRADVVRAALVDKGIDGDSITAEGRGEEEPVTLLDDCPDDLHECELIHCLRPDRRVEVTIEAVRRVRRC